MRKLCLPLILIATAAFAIGCEDGPDQTFQPAPPGAAGIWNNGNVDAAVEPGSTSFEAGYPTVNAVTLCSSDFKRKRWAWMLTQPIQPPRRYAGIDMAKDDLWDGLTIDEAEQPPANGDPNNPEGGLCQSVPLGFEGTCPSGIGGCNGSYWGNNGEVGFSWNVATHILDQMTLSLGYTGELITNKYPDTTGESHAYTLAVGSIYLQDGAPFEINWNDQTDREFKITNIFNAIMATYAPAGGVPFNTQTCQKDADCAAPNAVTVCECLHNTTGDLTTCQTNKPGQCGIADCATDGNCLVNPNNGGGTYFGIRPMVVYIVGNAGVPQPSLSTPIEIYNFFSKWEPYSNLDQTVTLDKTGPIAQGVPVGSADGGTCTQQIGQTFGNLAATCVQVTGNSTVDAVNLNKISHGLSHDQEHWTANVLGINQNFTSLSVANNPSAVVLDTDTPQPGDLSQDYEFDLRARGALANDGDLQGSAMVMIEWAREMLEDIANNQLHLAKPHQLGDACIGFNGNTPNYVALNTPSANAPYGAGCSGIEGLIIPNAGAYFLGGTQVDFSKDPGLTTADPNANLNPVNNYDTLGFYSSILHPGDIFGALCIDGNGAVDGQPFPTDCQDTSLSLWYNTLLFVTRVLGNGNINNLPIDMQDRRYYYKFFGQAYIKYLKAYGNFAATSPANVNNLPGGATGGLAPSNVVAQQIDLESMFFDYGVAQGAGGAQSYDKFEYIDRTTIGQGQEGTPAAAYNYIPWDFEFGSDIFGGNQRYDNWYRRMDREEIGMYSAMLADKTKTPASDNAVNITNLFGSPLLGGNVLSAVPGAWASFACATGTAGDPATNGCGINPPLDPNQTGLTPCTAAGTCADATKVCVGGVATYENGVAPMTCTIPCNFTTFTATGCASPHQVCVANGATEGCMEALMDKNGQATNGQLALAHYPGAWSRTPFSYGHSPIKVAPSDKHPEIGVASAEIPNFLEGPYTYSPIPPNPALITGSNTTGCPDANYTIDALGLCEGKLNSGPVAQAPAGMTAPMFNPLTPWSEVQPATGFSIPIDGQRDQWIQAGQLEYQGVLETYLVDYIPWVDTRQQSCVGSDDAAQPCNAGYTCDPYSQTCVASDSTIQVLGIEGDDFLGQAFLCQDPTTGDILHVGMYDSALAIVAWLANHPGSLNPLLNDESAQTACGIIVRSTPLDNYIDSITSKVNGVFLNIEGGQGLGRVTDIVTFDPGLIQSL